MSENTRLVDRNFYWAVLTCTKGGLRSSLGGGSHSLSVSVLDVNFVCNFFLFSVYLFHVEKLWLSG